MIDGFQESFRTEARELLNGLEQSLLELEQNPQDSENIAAVFRVMHTIKGSAGMFGFDKISAFAHHVESSLQEVRDGIVPVTEDLVDATLHCRDHILFMLDEPDDPSGSVRSRELQDMLASIVSISREQIPERGEDAGGDGVSSKETESDPEFGEDTSSPVPSSPGSSLKETSSREPSESAPPETWFIRFSPHREIMRNGTNPLLLLEELQGLGSCTVVAHTGKITSLEAVEALDCLVSWDIFLTTAATEGSIREVFLFVEDSSTLSISKFDSIDLSDDSGQYKRLGQILVDRGVVAAEVVKEALEGQKKLGQVLLEQGVDSDEINSALREQEHARKTREKGVSGEGTSSIRVQSEKLDDLVDLVGELVTLQARLSQVAQEDQVDQAALETVAETFERLIASLRDHTMSIRMLPVASIFSRFRRLVRDLSRDLGKDVELITSGGETALDKSVLERLQDPLVHVIRNSIDHGIEPPAVRKAAGKPSCGKVALRARHVGASVEIRVEDDGHGLDRERILSIAIDKGLVSPGISLEDQEVYDLVFQPGFSTAREVTTVSGRGVGMDVVRREMDAIGGTVSFDPRPAQGTALVMTIPLTLAIIDGLLVRIGSERFVVPLANVEECVEYQRHDSREKDTIHNRGELLPLVNLRRIFSVSGERPAIEQAVVVMTGIGRVGFIVDQVVGEHQTVIKNLGQMYRSIEAVSGATILGDGTVALILDIQRLTGQISHAGSLAE
ncbi:two-component system, chemotaxis family, sensor kinase CheA [Alkalispirochaeta americana]|uniref:Chemotaxis protein CheA n=1 Tax=Alkalispirochaeta americana TaxID=159291 RepID=A0A1N6QZ82_9SPIO|nr:chemotaxis protein CheA [Alkalispirochaeta americana]SIQ21913.1 two-component system, chemotaxis family, sensor kinase CheA [Alkalispirochaeta americana]